MNQYGYLFGHHYSPGYRHHYYRNYGRCYGSGDSYYRPYYYPRYYDGYASISIGSSGYFSPYYSDLGVVYSDTVVVEPAIVEETYFTAPPGGSSVVYIRPEAVIEQQTVTVLPSEGGTVAGVGPTLPGEPSNVAGKTAESPAPALVEKGNEAFRAGRYDEARSWHARAMLADSEDGYAKLFYGLANFAQGQYDVAASAFRRALMEVPELIDYPIDLRTVYDDPTVLTTQLGRLARVRSAHSADTELAFLLGYLYYATGDPQGAVSTLGALTNEDSDDTLARLVRDAAIRVLPGDISKPKAKKVVPSSKT
ncbi:MAG: tetratricopeptide repeat protein [Planctomycetes bacterium]|nr:tetratricopeptide repeat protein [Planctomycetota bacterium]